MKRLRQFKSKILYPACLYTFLISLILLIFMHPGDTPVIIGSIYLAVFGYCFLLAVSNLLLHLKRPNAVIRTALHFVINAALFFGLMKIAFPVSESLKITQTGIENRQYVVGMLLFLAVYAVLSGLRALILFFSGAKKTQSAEDYKSIF